MMSVGCHDYVLVLPFSYLLLRNFQNLKNQRFES